MAETATIRLSRKITVIGVDTDHVELAEPTGKDLVASGYPLRFVSDGTEIDAVAMNRLIAKVANIPVASVEMMAACDWQACALTMMGFFGPPETPPPS